MARFKTGDRVRREMSPANLIRLESGPSANQHALEIFDEYEVDSGANGTLIAYELNSA